jgi:hypothetical protein
MSRLHMCVSNVTLSLPHYICRFMIQQLRIKGRTHIGFIDPHIVFKNPQTLKSLKEDQEDNIKTFLEMHRNKRIILFPYNFRWVFITSTIMCLVITFLSSSTVYTYIHDCVCVHVVATGYWFSSTRKKVFSQSLTRWDGTNQRTKTCSI